ncbi:MAG: hypothetical protein JKY56_26085 [Kofleriaceae bacterium]|nr:hypothetical protein [Kofleriaceae bacterium]
MRDPILSREAIARLRNESLATGLLGFVVFLLVLAGDSATVHADSDEMMVELTTYKTSPDDNSTGNTCPTRQEFRAEVTQLLGRDPFSIESPAMRIEVKIQRSAGRFSGTLGSTGSHSSRSFEAINCPELTSTIALAVAIAIDPFFVRPPVVEIPVTIPDKEQPDSPTENTAVPPVEVSKEPAPSETVDEADDNTIPSARSTSSELRWSASLRPSLSLGLTPTVSGAIAMSGGLHLGRSSIELSATATTRGQENFPMGSLDAQVFYLSLAPCWNPAKYSVCASVSIGALRARGLAPLTERANILRVHSSMGMRAYVPLLNTKAFQIRWFVDGQARLSRTTLTVGNDQAWTTPDLFVLSGFEFCLDWKPGGARSN